MNAVNVERRREIITGREHCVQNERLGHCIISYVKEQRFITFCNMKDWGSSMENGTRLVDR